MVFYEGFKDVDGVTVLFSLDQKPTVAVINENFVWTPARLAKQRLQGFRAIKVRQGQPYDPEQILDQGLAPPIHIFHRLPLRHHQIKHFYIAEQGFLVLRLLEQTPALHVMRVHQK